MAHTTRKIATALLLLAPFVASGVHAAATSLEQLLEQVRSAHAAETKENAQRELEVKTSRDKQAALLQQAAPASVVMAPLKIGETILGVIALQSYQTNTYNAEHLALLIGASHQVAIAIENSRLYDALLVSQASARQQADQLATLNQIGRSLANLKNLQGALRATLEQISAILPLDSFVVALNDPLANTVSFPLLYDSGKFFEGETMDYPRIP